jgi:lipid-A-disaccharide synthase
MAASPSFALVAGEASGDLLAGLLLDGMRARWPGLRAGGIGGPRMAERGFEAWWPHEKLAVSGYVEVLRHYRELSSIRNELKEKLIADPPNAFIGVDAPDFNLDLELNLKARGIRTVHFVCPSIWAWRAGRVEKIRRAADHVLCIFPFEPPLLAQQGIASTYVGHPLANVIPAQPDQAGARRALGLRPDGEVLAILPGSRASEVQRLAPRFFEAAVRIRQARPGIEMIVPAVPARMPALALALRSAGLDSAVKIVPGQSHAALAACDVALVASGTATLEAALFKRPMVVVYVMHVLSWQMGKRMHYQPWISLPNILLRDHAVPELLQGDATAEKIAAAAFKWLDEPEAVAALRTRFEDIHRMLARDTGALATAAIEAVLAG